jgi:hypothetical protein
MEIHCKKTIHKYNLKPGIMKSKSIETGKKVWPAFMLTVPIGRGRGVSHRSMGSTMHSFKVLRE